MLRRVVVIALLACATCFFLVPYTPLYALTIAVWNQQSGDSRWYFALWVGLDTSVVLAAVVSAGDVAPVAVSPPSCTEQHSRGLRCSCSAVARRVTGFDSMWLLAPFALAVAFSMYAFLEMGVRQQALRYDWGRGFVPSEHHGRQFWQQWMQKSAL